MEVRLRGSFWKDQTDYLGDSKITFQFPASELDKVTEIKKNCIEKELEITVRYDDREDG